jgi:hypothetical protein
MFRPRYLLLLFGFLLIWDCATNWAQACDSAQCTCHQVVHASQRGCWLASSGSFEVCSFKSAREAEQVAKQCEKLRFDLARGYGFDSNHSRWEPKCEVYLFKSKSKYGAAIGRAGMETLGSSLVTPQTGVIKSRRIDLRTDVDNYLEEVLPHELTHVLIADHFRDGPPPLWYDEGLAILSDSRQKQALHQRDLRDGMRRGSTFALHDLLTTNQYPGPDKVSVFYGQCASLTRFLTTQDEARKVHEFARRSQEVGASIALQETYGISGIARLEPMWRKSITSSVAVIPARYSHKHSSD